MCLVLVISPSLLSSCKKNNKHSSKNLTINFKDIGVWWWDTTLDADSHLEFAKANGVTEIYYNDSNFDEKTAEFISKANALKIKVYYLDGDYKWLETNGTLIEKISKYQDFQKQYPSSNFAGVHLDIEPHQNPNFDTNRTSLIEKLIQTAKLLNTLYPSISFDYDIPFWLNDEIKDILSDTDNKIPAYKQIMSIANRTFVMSYRDTADEIFNISKEELEYSSKINKPIFLCVETKSDEGDNVSFMEESKTEMVSELNKLKSLISENVGISIHQIKTWKDLKID